MRLSYLLMIPLLAFVAMVQSVVGPRLAILGVHPDLVLLLVLLWTLLYGSYSGIVWAFWGGVWLDVLSGGPVGASSLALIAACLVAHYGHRRLFYTNPLVPLLTALLGTLVYSLAHLTILRITGYPLGLADTLGRLVLPTLFYNTVVMLGLVLLLRRFPPARPDAEEVR